MSRHGRVVSLGALFHHLRDGLADRGPARISLEFRLESTTSGGGGSGGSHLFVKRGFRAELDYQDEVLRRAHIVSTGMSPRPLAEMHILHREGRYLYSREGERFGLLIDTPRLYDVYSFEARLSRIEVGDVILEEEPQADGSRLNILRIGLGEEAFRDLVHVFGDDVEAMGERLENGDRSAVMTAGRDVAIHYRWTTLAEEQVPTALNGAGERYLSRHGSRVSIRLEPITRAGDAEVAVDPGMPQLGGIDDVWALARAARAPGR